MSPASVRHLGVPSPPSRAPSVHELPALGTGGALPNAETSKHRAWRGVANATKAQDSTLPAHTASYASPPPLAGSSAAATACATATAGVATAVATAIGTGAAPCGSAADSMMYLPAGCCEAAGVRCRLEEERLAERQPAPPARP